MYKSVGKRTCLPGRVIHAEDASEQQEGAVAGQGHCHRVGQGQHPFQSLKQPSQTSQGGLNCFHAVHAVPVLLCPKAPDFAVAGMMTCGGSQRVCLRFKPCFACCGQIAVIHAKKGDV